MYTMYDIIMKYQGCIEAVTSICIAICTAVSAFILIKSARNNNQIVKTAFQELSGFCNLLNRLNENDVMMKEKSISISVKPYFMSLCCRFDEKNGSKVVTITFQNKGNGPAYNIALNDARAYNAAKDCFFRQLEPIDHTAILVNEVCNIVLDIGKENYKNGVYVKLTLIFYDIQGKIYKENFELVIHEVGVVHNFVAPFVIEL